MKFNTLLCFLLLYLSLFSFGQNSRQTLSPNTNNWTYGGSLGLSFGSNSNFGFSLAPRVGYKLSPKIEAGLMGSYTNQGSRYFSSQMFGIGPFANYYFSPKFYASTIYQHYSIEEKAKQQNISYWANENALYLGGGYLQNLGSRTFLQIGLLYNVLYKENNSIFSSAFSPQIGVIFGL